MLVETYVVQHTDDEEVCEYPTPPNWLRNLHTAMSNDYAKMGVGLVALSSLPQYLRLLYGSRVQCRHLYFRSDDQRIDDDNVDPLQWAEVLIFAFEKEADKTMFVLKYS